VLSPNSGMHAAWSAYGSHWNGDDGDDGDDPNQRRNWKFPLPTDKNEILPPMRSSNPGVAQVQKYAEEEL
jgi:hypothetical protein